MLSFTCSVRSERRSSVERNWSTMFSMKIVFFLPTASSDSRSSVKVWRLEGELARAVHLRAGLLRAWVSRWLGPGLISTWRDIRYLDSEGRDFINSTTAFWGMVLNADFTSTFAK